MVVKRICFCRCDYIFESKEWDCKRYLCNSRMVLLHDNNYKLEFNIPHISFELQSYSTFTKTDKNKRKILDFFVLATERFI